MYFYISIFLSILFSLKAWAMEPMDIERGEPAPALVFPIHRIEVQDQRSLMHTEYKVLDDRCTVTPQSLNQNFSTTLPQGFAVSSGQTHRTLSVKKEDMSENQSSLKRVVIENREKVDGRRTLTSNFFPTYTHGYIKMVFKDENDSEHDGFGTGTLIGPRHVLTAGHCVCDNPREGSPYRTWAKSIEFYAGKHGDEEPFQPVKGIILLSVNAWVTSANGDYDFGMIILENDIGYETGWLGMLTTPIEFLHNFKPLVHATGYPDVRPDEMINRPHEMIIRPIAEVASSSPAPNGNSITNLQRFAVGLAQEEEGKQDLANYNYHLAFGERTDKDFRNSSVNKPALRYTMGHSLQNASEYRLQYILDTSKGQSGAGLWTKLPGSEDYYLIGTHVRYNGDANEATRINNEKFNCLCGWMNIFLIDPERYKTTIQSLKTKQTSFKNFLILANKTPNCINSQHLMGQLYQSEKCPWIYEADERRFPLHTEKALEWYMRAAANENIDAKREITALLPKVLREAGKIKPCTIGDYYFHSYIKTPPLNRNIIPLEYQQAGYWYTKAFKENDQEDQREASSRLANLFCEIGNLYFSGYGCDHFLWLPYTTDRWKWHYTQALYWYSAAGEAITGAAKINRVKIHATGHSIKERFSNPTSWETHYDFQRSL